MSAPKPQVKPAAQYSTTTGLITIALGVVLCARPGIGAITLALLFGLFNLIAGIWMLAQRIELRRTGKTMHSVRPAQPETQAA